MDSRGDKPSGWRGRLGGAALTIVAAVALIRIALPYVIEMALPRIAADQGLYAEIGNVDLELMRGAIVLDDLVIDFPDVTDVAGRRRLFALDRLRVAFEWTALPFRRIHVTDLALSHPVVALTQRADGGLALPDLAGARENDAGSDHDAEPETAETDWVFMLDRFELNEPEVALRAQDSREEVVRLGAEQLGFDGLVVGPDGIGIGGLDLEHPEVFVQRDWLLRLSQSSTEAEPVDAEPTTVRDTMPAIALNHLRIDRAAFTLRTPEGPLAVALGLEVSDAGTAAGQTFPIDLGLEIDAAKIDIDGRAGLNPTSFAGRVAWRNLSVPPILLLAYPSLVPWLASCDAEGDLQLVFSSVDGDAPAGLAANGTSRISHLSFKHPESGELAVEWKSLDLAIREAFVPLSATAAQPIRFELSSLSLIAPSIVYTNPPDALDQLLAELGGDSNSNAKGESPATAPDSGLAPRIAIDRVEVKDGMLRYVDRSVTPTHETKIHQLKVAVDEFAASPTPGAEAVSVDGLIQAAGSFKLRGQLPQGQGELEFSLRHLDLASYDSLARASGWTIETGTTSLDTTIEAAGDRFTTKNEIVLHDLDIAPEDDGGFNSRFGMSIDLVLALLRDPSGDIPLSVPIAVDEDGAGVELGPIVLSAVRNAIQGAIASPVKMLGMLVPTGAEPNLLGQLPFAPGEHRLPTDKRAELVSLVDFVESRPTLGLTLRGHWSPEDRLPMARKILEEKAIAGDDFPDVEGATFFAERRVSAALRARSRAEEGPLAPEDEALLERYVTAQTISEERLRALARSRAESLRTSLVELGAPSSAVSIGKVDASELPAVSLGLSPRAEPMASIRASSAP